MKLVLLPGLDGTGELFSPLLHSLTAFDCEVIRLPNTGSQDYKTLTDSILIQLPKDDFILIAESFSSPIGAAIANEGLDNLKGIIFVATFLSAPRKKLLGLARYLPLKFMANLPFSSYFHRLLFLGQDASREQIGLFQSTIRTLPAFLIRARLNSIHSLQGATELSSLPIGYIKASSDKLVPSGKATEFKSSFNNIIYKTIEGPHFILQAKPEESAKTIIKMLSILSKSDGTRA